VKLLVDESLQHELARILTEAGHDAVHVTDLDLNGAADDDVLTAAAETGRIVVTADTDFGTLLALSSAAGLASSSYADRDAAHPNEPRPSSRC
jgi:predicted nuclease of predicted toxin-antitoxin system